MTISLITLASRRGALVSLMAIAAPGAAFAEAVPLDTFGLSSMFVEDENHCLDAGSGPRSGRPLATITKRSIGGPWLRPMTAISR